MLLLLYTGIVQWLNLTHTNCRSEDLQNNSIYPNANGLV